MGRLDGEAQGADRNATVGRDGEAVIIDVEGQRQAVLQESAGQEIQVGQEGLPGINAGTGNESGAIVEDVEQGEVLLERRKPLVRGSVELPESAGILALPATNGGVGWPE